MSSRDRILNKVRDRAAGLPGRQDPETLTRRMAEHRPGLIPARADLPEPERLALFLAKCAELGVTVDRVGAAELAPEAIAGWLKQHNLPTELRLAPAAEVADLPWARAPMLDVETGAADIGDQVSVTPAAAAIAETGTLVMTSDPSTPATLNFVPDNHVVVLRRGQVVRAMEDAFAMIRERFGEGRMPRTVNMISGASRTGDVEQKIVMGAHGPRRLHIVLIDDGG
ncbi:LutC/YkgG family protein [Minwuia thermotolerans]|uniref:Lactate utilization protein n=1 Tax=Minwuia thermotolerans TaxID=2056226 RepID=A0A2M9G6J9_9PROT|nr:LUD domain-containing protein [Minwuia thermotolerans]PJK31296.1 lactate utilization protein [Minwuia thermotolerans]